MPPEATSGRDGRTTVRRPYPPGAQAGRGGASRGEQAGGGGAAVVKTRAAFSRCSDAMSTWPVAPPARHAPPRSAASLLFHATQKWDCRAARCTAAVQQCRAAERPCGHADARHEPASRLISRRYKYVAAALQSTRQRWAFLPFLLLLSIIAKKKQQDHDGTLIRR